MTKKRSNKQSTSSLLKSLWEGDFFAEAHDLSEVQQEIATKGYHFSSSILSVALMRLVRSGEMLTRIKKDGKWRYIQKRPFSYFGNKKNKPSIKYDFHPRIKQVAYRQFKDGYYKEAIQNALVEVVDQVKVKANYPKKTNGRELDGDDLMNHIFGCDNQQPIIRFNSLTTSLDKAEQRGIMNLFKGIVGIRDKKAHLNFIQNNPLKTIEYLSLASLLMRLLDENTTT